MPQADVATVDGNEFHEPRSTPAGSGTQWIGDAWRLFKLSPGLWIAMFIVYGACLIVIGMVPFLGNLFAPVFMAGFYRAAQTAHEEGVVRLEDLFSGFRERLGPLILLGVLSLALLFGIVLVGFGIGMALFGTAVFDPASGGPDIMFMLVVGLIVLALVLPMIMMSWFSPALVLFEGMGAFEAMKCSFMACLKNILPFTIYSIVLSLLALVAVIPLGLGLIVVLPLMMITAYTSYHDIFVAND